MIVAFAATKVTEEPQATLAIPPAVSAWSAVGE